MAGLLPACSQVDFDLTLRDRGWRGAAVFLGNLRGTLLFPPYKEVRSKYGFFFVAEKKIAGMAAAYLLADSRFIVALSRGLHVIELDAQSKIAGERPLKTSICPTI